ncbi:MAG: hypothetical protein IIV48_05875 [Clostridium sp.]|nr:hypothetical protein [Clostridium sp.]
MSIASKLTKLETDITNAYSSINTKGGTIPNNKNTENLQNAISSIPTGPSNVYIFTYTLSAHNSGNVALGTLPDDVYSHRNDENFTVVLTNLTPTQIVQYDEYNIMTTNNSDVPKNSTYPVYGIGCRKTGATAMITSQVYYPPNSTNNTNSLGGLGKIWMNGKVLTYKSYQYFLGAGTWQITITW